MLSLKEIFLRLLLCVEGPYWRYRRGKGIILTYHGVLPDNIIYKAYPYKNFVFKSSFQKQMAFIRNKCDPLSLFEMINLLKKNKKLPDRAISITFDDGYKNNIEYAVPILKKFGLPATFFISSGFIGANKIIPAEEFRLLLYYVPSIRKEISKIFNVPLLERDVRVWINKILMKFKKLPLYQGIEILNKIKKKAKNKIDNEKTLPFKFMDIEDIQQLSKIKIFEIGCHTVNHVILSRVSEKEAYEEIIINKKHLEEWTGISPTLFSYPNGNKEDFNKIHQKMLKKMNFMGAVTQIQNFVTLNVDFYSLPRFNISQEHSENTFKAYLNGLIGFLKQIFKLCGNCVH